MIIYGEAIINDEVISDTEFQLQGLIAKTILNLE